MPVFNLELRFNDKGAQEAAKQIHGVADAASGAQQAVGKLGDAAGRSTAPVVTMGKQGAKAGADISAAMKRAVKNVLALVGAYKSLDAAKSFAQRGVEMDAASEQSKIGIASVIASVNQLEDAQGNLLKGQEAYQAALGLAEQAMNRIKIMGLETTATTEDLVAGFQQLIGPAAAAGLSMEQTLKFTTSMVQSLGAIGIPFNQLSAEARSLLDGTIVPTQDRLAVTLGITGDMVRNWKEQGILAEKLLEKMSAFAAAGDDVARTWSGVKSNLQDAVDVIAGVSSAGLYEDLKESLLTLQNLLVDTSDTASGVGPDVKNIVEVLTLVEDKIGGAILASVTQVVNLAKEFNTAIGSGGAITFLDDLTDALKVAAGALAGLAVARKSAQISVSIAGEKERLLEEAKATALNAQEKIKAARAAREEWAATKQFVEQEIRNLSAARQSAETTKQLAAYRQELKIATNAAADAERDLVSAMTTSRAARDKILKLESGAGTVSAIGSKLKTAWSGLIGLFGGPWGIAITAASTALTHLATKQTDAERAAKLHTEAEEAYQAAVKGATDSSGNLTRQLTQVEKTRLNIAKNKYEQEWAYRVREVGTQLEEVIRKTQEANALAARIEAEGGNLMPTDLENVIPQELLDTTVGLFSLLENKGIALEDFKEELASIRSEAVRGGAENSEYVKTLDTLLASNTLEDLAARLRQVGSSIAGMAQEVRVAKQELASPWAVDTSGLDKFVKKAQDSVRAAKAEMAGLKGVVGLADLFPKLDPEKVSSAFTAYKEYAKGAKDDTAGMLGVLEKFGGTMNRLSQEEIKNMGAAFKSAMDQEAAEASLKAFREAHKSTASAAKTAATAQIDFQGELERTRQQVESLQQQLGLDKTEDLTRAKISIEQKYQAELSKTNEELAKRVTRGQLTPQQADTLRGEKAEAAELERRLALKEAEQKAEERLSRNLETRVNFYRELARLSGNYEQSLEEQNRLIQKQKEEWERAEIATKDVARRVELMKQELSRDPFDGLARGARKWANEATDLGRQMETFITSTLDNTADSFAEFCLTGKASFSDLANSIISDLYRIASKQFLGGIVGGLMGGIGNMLGGGLFGGGGFSLTSGQSSVISNAFGMGAGAAAFARGGVVSGGNLSDYSGRVVTSPTFFAYDRHLSAFANGAGLMGEAGPEAVMPLAKTTRGELGVRMVWGEDMARDVYHADDWKRQRGFSDNTMRMIADMQATIRRERQSQMNAVPQITIKVINNSNAQVEAGQMRQDGNGGFSMDIIVSQVEQAIVGRMRQGKSQIAQYQEKAYGMSRAGVLARGRGRS